MRNLNPCDGEAVAVYVAEEHNAAIEDQTKKSYIRSNHYQSSSHTTEDEENANEPNLEHESVAEHDVNKNSTGEEGGEEISTDEETNDVDGARGGQQQILIVGQIDQSRKPVRGDLIAFVKDNFWVRAKIKSRAPDNRRRVSCWSFPHSS